MSMRISGMAGKPQSAIHTFVCKVITHAENKLGRITATFAVVLHKCLCNLALVHKLRTNLKVGFACHNLDIVLLCNGPLEVFLALTRLECAVFGVGSPVVPR